MAVTVYTGDDVEFYFKQQAAWGTAETPAANFTRLDVEKVAFDPDVFERESERHGSNRAIDPQALQYDTKGSAPKITISGPVRKNSIDHFMQGLFQGVTEAALTPFLKQITPTATQPDLTAIATVASPGWIGTFTIEHPVASHSHVLTDGIMTSLTLSCDPNNNNGRLHYSADIMGRGALVENSNPSGSPTADDSAFFHFSDLKFVQRAAADLDLLNFSFTFTNGAVPVGVDTADASKFLTFAFLKYEVAAQISVIWESALNNHNPNTAVDWAIYWGDITPLDGFLQILATLKGKGVPNYGADVLQMDFNLRGVTGTSDPAQLEIANAVDRTWT